MRALSGLRMLGKKEEAASARVYLNSAPPQRLGGGVLAKEVPRDLIPVLAPDGPASSRGSHCGSGGEGRWEGVWGRLPFPSPFRDRRSLFPEAAAGGHL